MIYDVFNDARWVAQLKSCMVFEPRSYKKKVLYFNCERFLYWFRSSESEHNFNIFHFVRGCVTSLSFPRSSVCRRAVCIGIQQTRPDLATGLSSNNCTNQEKASKKRLEGATEDGYLKIDCQLKVWSARRQHLWNLTFFPWPTSPMTAPER